MTFAKKLIKKIENKDATICIIGLGYVGLPLIIRFSSVGYKVLGIDRDIKKIRDLKKTKSYINHISDKSLHCFKKNKASFDSGFEQISKADAIILCVPTPLDKHKEPDLSYVEETVKSVMPFLKKGQLISLESTTFPGTTEEMIVKEIERKRGFKVGEDFFVSYSPEREDPGNKNFTTNTIPKICGGHTTNCLKIAMKVYGSAIESIVPVSSTKVAEMTKLLENIYRAVNIGLVNEMKIVSDKMGIDIFEVIDAASTKPFGFTPYYPGPGLGGHCIPIDPFYLSWKAKEYDINARFIELAGEINASMPNFVIDKIINGLNKHSKAINKSKILLLGLSYKKNIDDLRESPSLKIIEKLVLKGAKLNFNDPYFESIPKLRNFDFNIKFSNISKKNLSKFDCIVIATDHDAYDYAEIQKHSKLIIDTRGIYRKKFKNVIRS